MKKKDELNQIPDEQIEINGEENTTSEIKTKKTSDSNLSKTGAENSSGKTEKGKPSKAKKKDPVSKKSDSDKPSEISKLKVAGPKPEAEANEEATIADDHEISIQEATPTAEPAETISVVTTENKETEKPVEIPEVVDTEEENKLETIDEISEVEEDNDNEEDHDDDDDDHESKSEETTETLNFSELSPEELVSMLENLVQEDKITNIRNKVALIKVAFLKHQQSSEEKQFENFIAEDQDKTEIVPEKSELDIRFSEAFKIYSKKRKAFLAELEKKKFSNLDQKKIILEELKALIDSEESLKKTYDEFKVLQEKWKEIGMVPKSEVNNLWQSYHFLVEKFFDKVKINRELRDLDMRKNLETKMELCEKAEELLIEKSIIKSFKQLQHLHTLWKDVGPVPNDKKEELWDRFKGVSDKINKLRHDHYNKINEEQKTSYMAKTAICEKAEEIIKLENKSIKEWHHTTEQMSELLKVWKTIGPAPRGQNDEIWERFRISLDSFFATKKDFYQSIKEEQNNNYNMKLELCIQAEALKDSSDWKNTTQELINLQNSWKNIGPVPRKHSDKIWKRFRAACDEFFNKKAKYFGNVKQHEQENLELKRALISEVEAFEFSNDKKENLSVIKDFQRKFTEIGHVPFKEKEKAQTDFRNAINKQLDKLKIKRTEMQTINFKQKFEDIKDSPNAGRIINSEINFLVQKKKKLEDEVQLLENNVGFLAKSAKADLLKQEFMKKIDGVRNEIALISEKIKFLNKEAK